MFGCQSFIDQLADSAEVQQVVGDVDGNGELDNADVLKFFSMAQQGSDANELEEAGLEDLNNDGKIDMSDVHELARKIFIDSQGGIAVDCPVLQETTETECADGRFIHGGFDSNWCPMPKLCVPKDCPAYAFAETQVCESGFWMPGGFDDRRCPMPPLCHKKSCPVYPKITQEFCPMGIIQTGGVDQAGCPLPPRCVPKACPTFQSERVTTCEGGEITIGGFDDLGCPMPPICRPKTCPAYDFDMPEKYCIDGLIVHGGFGPEGCPLPPVCRPKQCWTLSSNADENFVREKCEGYWTTGSIGPDGCPMPPVCQPKECPMYTMVMPNCPDGRIISGGFDQNGCPLPPRCQPKDCPVYRDILGGTALQEKITTSSAQADLMPVYWDNFCPDGTPVSGGFDDRGCPLPPTCKPKQCPMYPDVMPRCEDGAIITGGFDPNGCPLPPRCQPVDCPVYRTAVPNATDAGPALGGVLRDEIADRIMEPACPDGELVPGGYDERGCPLPPVCKPRICPAYPTVMPVCKDGEIVPGGFDQNGCPLPPVCKPKVCPMYTMAMPVCENGEIISGGFDQNGCPLPPRCKPYECPQYADMATSSEAGNDAMMVYCPDGNMVFGGYDDRGCPLPPVCKPKECPIYVRTPDGDLITGTSVGTADMAVSSEWCIDGTITSGGYDEIGCPLPPVCRPKICPMYDYDLRPDFCLDGKILQSTGEDGCPLPPTCVRPETCPGIPEYFPVCTAEQVLVKDFFMQTADSNMICPKPPRCAPKTCAFDGLRSTTTCVGGQKVVAGFDEKGCPISWKCFDIGLMPEPLPDTVTGDPAVTNQ